MFFALVAEVALVSFAVPEYESRAADSHWDVVLSHTMLAAHVLLGTAKVLGSAPIVVAAMREAKTNRKIVATVAMV
ncbi:hypothetical protein JNM87_04245 [Candidatus Saccharibacteria bacterium]|nr:hypothetical protein [Candidatus Saccharibacteria bacterium]